MKLAVLLGLLGWLASAHASAQSCHAVPYGHHEELRFDTTVGVVAAEFNNAASSGHYQGLSLGAAMQHRWVTLAALLTGYRLTQSGTKDVGVGDLLAAARVPLLRAKDDASRFGVALAATLPTGSERDGLGMGHLMLMPGLFASLQTEHWQLLVDVAYGRALDGSSSGSSGDASGAHAGHGGSAARMPMPVVNPMNRSELEHAFELVYRVTTEVGLLSRMFGAVPVFDASGGTREALAVGVKGEWTMLTAATEIQIPIVGDPFRFRSISTIGVNW